MATGLALPATLVTSLENTLADVVYGGQFILHPTLAYLLHRPATGVGLEVGFTM
jgi:hypothetical protein